MLRNSILFIALFITSINFTFANTGNHTNPNTKDTFEYNKITDLNVTQVITLLQDGTWFHNNLENETLHLTDKTFYQFLDFGMVDIITESKDGNISLHHMFWTVENTSTGFDLILTDPPTMENFTIPLKSLDYNRILMGNEQETQLVLSTPVSTNNALKNDIQTALTGAWEMNTYPFDIATSIDQCGAFEAMKGSYFNLDLNEDGTYTKSFGSLMVNLEETGIWEVSNDGNYILFHAVGNNNAENVYATKLAKIKKMDNDQIIIRQALDAPGSYFEDMFCTITKDFVFDKK